MRSTLYLKTFPMLLSRNSSNVRLFGDGPLLSFQEWVIERCLFPRHHSPKREFHSLFPDWRVTTSNTTATTD